MKKIQDIKVQKIHPDAKFPEYKTPGAAAADVYSIEEVTIKPGEVVFIKTGLTLELPKGTFMMILPRSSLCLKQHLDMPHSIGLLDEDYRSELMIVYRNIGSENVTLEKSERIAQLLIGNYVKVNYIDGELSDSERKGGFGSTGKF